MMRFEAKALVAAGEPMGMAPEQGERVEWGVSSTTCAASAGYAVRSLQPSCLSTWRNAGDSGSVE